VTEYADFNIERGLSSSNDLKSEAALVTPRITVEYADYLSTNGLVTYSGPIPEFPSTMILLLFMIATLFVVTAYKRKHFHSTRGKDGK
jgi:hypothetical protein